MDQAGQIIHRRKAKYMAQVLESFEKQIEPHLPDAQAGEVQDFKGLVRARINALATDAADLLAARGDGFSVNGAAQELRDRLHPTGRP